MDSTATIYDQIPFSDMGHDDYLVRIQQSHNAEGETYIDFIE